MPASAEPVRIIQVGAGAMGRAWLQAITDSDQADLVGLVDLDQEAASQAADAAGFSGVPVARSLERLLDRVDAQAVLNVTVPEAHASVSIAALLHGLPVLCEKPLAESVSAGLSMIAAAELSGKLLMVSQSRRYWRTLSAFRQQIAQLGCVGTLTCDFFKAPRFGGFREEMAYPLLLDMAIHQFDLARDLIGDEPVAVFCDSYNPSWSWYRGDAAAHVLFEFAGGSRFGFNGSWCSPGLETSWNGEWRASGAGGSATWDGDHAPTATDADGGPIAAMVGDEPEQIAGSLAEFEAALRTGTIPSGEAHSNVLSLAMVEAAIRSTAESRRVLIAEVLDEAHAVAVGNERHPEIRAVLESWESVQSVTGAAQHPHGRPHQEPKLPL
ncbi:MAG: Myo-inositol 2-dehydrogenase [uncultured Propionibacteriaceae bacterium]|uniref:Myo-inositol 2-dehydrogenase n=1 Tax=uncultured Propionibacteriaceae bacterium TaxID=257457 RepID=A0A6J4NCT2_9ACTN|nr:MAG: Myo-inositol 2-dehydrogenase [uncultured Propionibacteriaceae bacterium]